MFEIKQPSRIIFGRDSAKKYKFPKNIKLKINLISRKGSRTYKNVAKDLLKILYEN